MKTHYRSIAAQSDLFTTTGNPEESKVFYYPAIELNGARFWAAAGGAQPVDTAVGVPDFQDDIILRGGMVNLTIGNNAGLGEEDIKVKVYLIISDETPSTGALIPPNGSGGVDATFSREWDPSLVPDAQRVFGKTIFWRSALIKSGDSLNVSHRLRVQKIDQQDYLNDNKKMFWVVCATQNVSANNQFTVTASFNLSFSGDAITPN